MYTLSFIYSIPCIHTYLSLVEFIIYIIIDSTKNKALIKRKNERERTNREKQRQQRRRQRLWTFSVCVMVCVSIYFDKCDSDTERALSIRAYIHAQLSLTHTHTCTEAWTSTRTFEIELCATQHSTARYATHSVAMNWNEYSIWCNSTQRVNTQL